MEVYFNGYRLRDYVDRIRDIRRDILPPRTLMTQEVPGRDGAYLFDVKRGPRITEVDIMLIDRSFEALRERTEELAAILDTEETAELTFSDEGGKVRYAILDGETRLDEILYTGQTTLIFYQPDPHKYGPTRTQVIAAPSAGFTRNSTAYREDGTQVQANEPRYEPGKFGQALMVEEGTTNILGERSDGLTRWTANEGLVVRDLGNGWVEVEVTDKTKFADWGAQRQTSFELEQGTTYTFSLEEIELIDFTSGAASIGIEDFNGTSPDSTRVSLQPNITYKKTHVTRTINQDAQKTHFQIRFNAQTNNGAKIRYRMPQVERKDYPTSFIDGSRENEVVTIQTEGVLFADEGTVDIWVWVDEIVRRQQSGRWNRIFDIQKSVGGAGIGLYHQPGSPNWTLEVRGDDDVYQGVNVNDSYTPNGWNMFTIKWSAQEAVLLINGVRRGVLNNPSLPSGLKGIAHIGSGGSTSHINTKFDSLRLSRIARTDEEISAYDLTKPLPVDEHTTAVYRFDGSLTAASPNVIDNQGAEPTYPTFRATVLEPITFLNIVSPDDYMRIGRPVEVEEEPFEQYETILKDDCSTLVGWSTRTAGEALFGAGIVGGSMQVHDGYAFTPETYGDNPNGWVGPAIQKSLAEPLQDFRVTIDISLRNVPRGCGKVVLFLIDEAGEPVGYLSMMDTTSSYPMARGVVQVAGEPGHHIINYTGDVPGVWNDFRGILRLERVGQQFTAHIAKVRQDGTHHARHTRHFTDADGRFQRKVASIVVYIAKAKHYDTFFQSMNDISVWKINNPADYQVPYIAEAGDELVFDHSQNLILRNGEPILWSKDFGARFFPIHPGQTEIAVQPEGSTLMTADWRDVYK